MILIRYVQSEDRAFWRTLDPHLSPEEFDRKARDRMGYVLLEDERPIGLLRYQLFGDSIPFCTLLFIDSGQQRRGYGRQLMAHWEAEMRAKGYRLVMTSTRSDEQAQHFYRRLDYRDAGGLLLDVPGFEQPLELFLVKTL